DRSSHRRAGLDPPMTAGGARDGGSRPALRGDPHQRPPRQRRDAGKRHRDRPPAPSPRPPPEAAHALLVERPGLGDQRRRFRFRLCVRQLRLRGVRLGAQRGVLINVERALLQLVQQRVEPGVRKRGGLAFRHASRRAVVTGRRAARRAGNRPPTRPMPSAHFSPVHSSSGETLNWNTTWLKLLPRVLTLYPLKSAHATSPPSTPPSRASSIVSSITASTTGRPRKPMARIVAISRARPATAAYIVLSA